MTSERPRTDQPHYGRHLGDTTYWGPYVDAALDRAGLPAGRPEAGEVGTFPTFLVGSVAVKLFGKAFDGARSYATELAMHHLLAGHTAIPAPELIATGHLYPEGGRWSWPYLITRRLSGVALGRSKTPKSVLFSVATDLGTAVAHLHHLPAPTPVAARDLIPELREDASGRVGRYGLPGHLVEQVPDYLADAGLPPALVHADITADHVFVAGGSLEGIIDWGDAIVADPYYEFVPVYFDALGGSTELFEAFLAGYGFERQAWSPKRALQAVLQFQFNAIGTVGEMLDLERVPTLDELADRVFGRLTR